MANIFILGVTSASLSFLAVVGMSSVTFDTSHAQGTDATSSVVSAVAPSSLPDDLRTEMAPPLPKPDRTIPTGQRKMDRTLRAFAVERLGDKLGSSGLRDGVSAHEEVRFVPQGTVRSGTESTSAERAPKPKRLPRII